MEIIVVFTSCEFNIILTFVFLLWFSCCYLYFSNFLLILLVLNISVIVTCFTSSIWFISFYMFYFLYRVLIHIPFCIFLLQCFLQGHLFLVMFTKTLIIFHSS